MSRPNDRGLLSILALALGIVREPGDYVIRNGNRVMLPGRRAYIPRLAHVPRHDITGSGSLRYDQQQRARKREKKRRRLAAMRLRTPRR